MTYAVRIKIGRRKEIVAVYRYWCDAYEKIKELRSIGNEVDYLVSR